MVVLPAADLRVAVPRVAALPVAALRVVGLLRLAVPLRVVVLSRLRAPVAERGASGRCQEPLGQELATPVLNRLEAVGVARGRNPSGWSAWAA